MFIAPAVAGERVIVASCAGSVYALDRATGKPAWTYDTAEDGPEAEFHGEAILVGSTLVLPSDAEPAAHVYAFDHATGEVRWKRAFPGGVMTTPLLAGRSIIVSSATGTLARLDLETGKVLWSVAPDGARPALPRIPEPAADAKRVYFASSEPRLFAVDAANGRVLWKKDLPARITTSVALHGNTVYAGAFDGHLYAFDAASGAVRQRIPLGGPAYGTLVVAPPLLIALVNAKPFKLVAYDLAKKRVRWERTADREWSTYKPLVHDGTVIAGTEKKELCAFALGDGTPRWCTPVPQVPRGLGVAGRTLYLGTLNGRVLSYRF